MFKIGMIKLFIDRKLALTLHKLFTSKYTFIHIYRFFNVFYYYL